MAERVGFEPTCPLQDKTLSRRPRYDHFGTSPWRVAANGTSNYSARTTNSARSGASGGTDPDHATSAPVTTTLNPFQHEIAQELQDRAPARRSLKNACISARHSS